MRRLAPVLLAVFVLGSASLAQGPAGPLPGPNDPEWGAYRSGNGFPVFSDDLQERAEYEAIDPRCLMTITIALDDNPNIAANVENGLLEVLIEGVTRAEAQAVLQAESPYFNSDIDCAGNTPAVWRGGTYRSRYGDIDFGGGETGRGVYEDGDSVIIYMLIGRTMMGYWVEPSSARKCDAAVGGSEYWGWITFEFSESFDSWSGEWGYCDGGSSGSWWGSRD